jgi:vitamin B12 transporter
MRKKLYLFSALLVLTNFAYAQLDSLLLDAVEVRGIPYEKYAVGQKVVTADSSIKKQYAQNNIGDLLAATNPVYIRSYGNNMAAGISFRGTGPNHTGVFWNGININSRTLGQSDFSLLPVLGTDEISLQYGSSGALYGSDAIGGTVHLNNHPNWKEGLTLGVNQGLGSFGTTQISGLVNYAKGKVNFKSSGYYQQSDNDFPYTIPSNGRVVKQNNASYKYYGFNQDIYIQLASNKLITFNGWFNSNYREIQPVIGNFTSQTDQEDESIRLTAAYHHNSNFAYTTFRTGFVKDYQLYNQGSVVQARQIINQIQSEKKWKKVKATIGVNHNHIIADVDSYDKQQNEDRIDFFALSTLQLTKLTLAANLRYNLVSGYSSAFAPSISSEYALNSNWKLVGQLSKNYRVPTLNDRYWSPGGNVDLKAETSYNTEGGLSFKKGGFSASANYYKMWVSEWIIWVPESNFWTPKNIRKVNSEGIEVLTNYEVKRTDISMNLSAGYSFNIAEPTNTISATDRSLGEQLPYTPKHNANAAINLVSKFGRLLITGRYTGERATIGSTILEGYFLMDATVGKRIKSNIGEFDLSLSAKNVLGAEYQSIINTSMPGRYYQFNFNYLIQFKKR